MKLGYKMLKTSLNAYQMTNQCAWLANPKWLTLSRGYLLCVFICLVLI